MPVCLVHNNLWYHFTISLRRASVTMACFRFLGKYFDIELIVPTSGNSYWNSDCRWGNYLYLRLNWLSVWITYCKKKTI